MRRIRARACVAALLALPLVGVACGLDVIGIGTLDPAPTDTVDDAALAGDVVVSDGDLDASSVVLDGADGSSPSSCPPGFVVEGGAAGCVDRARNHFTLLANPSGNWTWAFRLAAPASPVVTYPTSFAHDAQAGIHVWSRNAGAVEPAVFFNARNLTVHPYGSFTMEPSDLAFHPGPQNERSVVRWTAPTSRTFAATVIVRGLSGWSGAPPTTTGVTVLKNTTVIGSTQLPTPDAGPSVIDVPPGVWSQGETLDVQLDYGSNGNYSYDSTGVDVTVIAP